MLRRLGRFLLKLGIVVAVFELLSFAMVSIVLRRVALPRTLFATAAQQPLWRGSVDDRGCAWGQSVALHPFLSYRYHHSGVCQHRGINELGLVGGPLPARRDPERYTILVLGGSVAEQLDRDWLVAKLNERWKSPNGKPFTVINGAIAGGAQPMQVEAFLLLQDLADAAISVEGYNEHHNYDSGRLELPPGIWRELAAASGADYRRILWHRLASDFYDWLKNNAVFSRSYTGFFVAYVFHRATASPVSGDEPAMPPLPPSSSSDDKHKIFIASYDKYLSAIHAIAQARGYKTAFLLQPVPALGKPLTDNDRKVVGALDYGPSYKDMVDRLVALRSHGLPMVSLLEIFATYRDDLYGDSIHFFDAPGHHRFAEAVADSIGNEWKLTRLRP